MSVMKGNLGSEGRENNKMTLTLSTGYEVEINLKKPQPDLEHLARALMGEIIFPKLKKTLKSAKKRQKNPGWIPGLLAAKDEILELVHDMESADLRLLTI